jgi:hypothetical protein
MRFVNHPKVILVLCIILPLVLFLATSSFSKSKSRDNSYWVHGTAVTVHPDDTGLSVVRNGAQAIITSTGEKCFDIPIVTRVEIEDTDAELVEFYVLFKTTNGAEVKEVQLNDGYQTVDRFPCYFLEKDYSEIKRENTFTTEESYILQNGGLNIRLCVDFGNSGGDSALYLLGVGVLTRREWD